MVLCASTAHGWVSLESVLDGDDVILRQSKRELCSAQRKWAFSLESLDGGAEKIEGVWQG